MKLRSKLSSFLLAVLLLVPGISQAWWNDQWPYRLPIAVDTSAAGAAIADNVADATVLVKLHSGNFGDFFLLQDGLADVRFIGEDDRTPLKFHVESVDLINQLIYIWVRVPQLTGGIDTGRLWMYYGKADAVIAQDSGGSFDVATALVLHFDAQAFGADATANGNDATAVTATPVTAQIGGGAAFDGNGRIDIADAPSLAVRAETGATLSLWLKPTGVQSDAILFQRAGAGSELTVGVDADGLYARFARAGQVVETARVAALRADNWQHLALVLESGRMALFVDGGEVAGAALEAAALAGDLSIGGGFVGEIDELRFDTVARSTDWVKLQANNQGLDRLLRPQQAEQLGDGGGGHGSDFWNVIVGSQDEAGWAVLILLMVMAAICFAVMIGKGIYVSRVQKDNERFLEKYRELGAADPALLDHEEREEDRELDDAPITQALFGKHDHFQSSPIYHVYHRAVQEVRARIGTSVGARAAGLTPAAISAIRATLDTQIVREMQRLNSQMVLLTIGVAGGPFIGLFGTVIGVMIVFAAIAASGDVNINAIAPGVAAALAATVMGLFVAIPALFAYNYLMSKIKAITADMRVFSDELVTRLAEYYGEK